MSGIEYTGHRTSKPVRSMQGNPRSMPAELVAQLGVRKDMTGIEHSNLDSRDPAQRRQRLTLRVNAELEALRQAREIGISCDEFDILGLRRRYLSLMPKRY